MRFQLIVASVMALGLAGCADSTSPPAASAAAGAQQSQQPARAGVVPGSQEDLATTVGDRVFFAFDRADLSPEARATLDNQAAWLNRYPQARVNLMGHADERGTREYNLALAERRAARTRDYLVSKGINRQRVDIISYGKECPRVVGNGDASWAQNRRSVTGVNYSGNSGTCPAAPYL